jgi:hypothetical protein
VDLLVALGTAAHLEEVVAAVEAVQVLHDPTRHLDKMTKVPGSQNGSSKYRYMMTLTKSLDSPGFKRGLRRKAG